MAIGRRSFLKGAAATVAGALVGCGGDDDASPGSSTSSPTSASTSSTPTTRAAVRLASDPFTLGVASGDPLADGIVLWTRLALDPLADDGLGAMPGDRLDVEWEVAVDDRFASVVRSGRAVADPADAHAVHVDVDGLDPGTDLHYRFRVGEFTSPVGRTRTLPDGSPDRLALAVVNCQWYETGSYAAYRHLAAEDLDLVLHLGDYIYEYAGVAGPRFAAPGHQLVSLADYRLRYAAYKRDADLQAAHARFPFMATWDDHEVANNYSAGTSPAGEQRAAAYRAWWEHLPVRLGPPDGPALRVHRAAAAGDLARLYVLDERQYADEPPCRPDEASRVDFGDCPDRTAGDRTYLGDDQEAWFAEASGRGGVVWDLVGNPVTLAGIDAGTGTPAYYLDSWDGFPAAQRRFIDELATLPNPVVLTGDYHVGMVLDVHARPFEESPVVAPELLAPAISSPLFDADVSARTPHLREQLNGHGYLVVEVDREHVTARFRLLEDVQDPASPIRTASTWRVAAGSHVAERV